MNNNEHNIDQKKNSGEELELDLSPSEAEQKRKVKRRIDDILEQKRLRQSIGMDETHNYWDEL